MSTPTLIKDLEDAADLYEEIANGASVVPLDTDRARGARLRDAALRLREEMAALEVRSKDKRDPLTDHAFCALNALTRINGGPVTP